MALRTITSEIKTQFVHFMMRDGWTHADAVNELNYLMVNSDILHTKEFYVYRVLRAGAMRTLTRVGRVGVYQTMENAINHVTFGEPETI